MPAELPLDSPGPTAEAKFKPVFHREGWYDIDADFESNEFNGGSRFSILLYRGKVYYDWVGRDLLDSMILASLKDHKEYQMLLMEAKRKRDAWQKKIRMKSCWTLLVHGSQKQKQNGSQR